MHILCTICSDLVNQAESLFVTKCGHIFHHQCLAQWIERSKSCPQCRNKVTDKCMFRMYPTVSNENSGEDAATLQSRLDDAMLQLRTQRTSFKELEDRLSATCTDLNKKEELLKASEKRLVSREAAAAALREQLEYAREQAREAQRLRDDNDRMHKNMQTLNGLQKVLNATAEEVEGMLRDYADVRTVAVFAAALKRALCDSERKKRESRARQLAAAQDAAAQRARADHEAQERGQLQEKLLNLERKYESLKHKRKASAEDDARAAKLPRAAPPSPSPAPPAAPSPSPSSPATPAAPDSFRDERRCSGIAADDSFVWHAGGPHRELGVPVPAAPAQRAGAVRAAAARAARAQALGVRVAAVVAAGAQHLQQRAQTAPGPASDGHGAHRRRRVVRRARRARAARPLPQAAGAAPASRVCPARRDQAPPKEVRPRRHPGHLQDVQQAARPLIR